VLSRFLAFDDDLASSAGERKLWDHATRLLPDEGIESYTQGLMDLGATVCVTRSPHCLLCPVQADCQARQQDRPEAYPIKTRKLKRGKREHVWLWLQWRDQLWLTQRPDTGVWAGLWSLPEFDSGEAFDALAEQWPGEGEALDSFTHVLTHLDWRLHPIRWTLPAKTKAEQVTQALPAGRWFTLDEALAAGVPAPLRKLLATP
jgi:A/G-specific adenine glycosylase